MSKSNPQKEQLFIVSGPSGVGKTVLCNEIIKRFAPKVVYSISTTSRPPRGGEIDGQEYFFYSNRDFEIAIECNEFAEWALVHNNYYGTPKAFLDKNRADGHHVILNIDVQGALKIKNLYSEAIMIFILPPSFEELEARIRKRNIDSEDSLKNRLENAKNELDFRSQYEYTIVNDNLETAISELVDIYKANTTDCFSELSQKSSK